jgi:D-serine deaminase-like pyridoxal phosphate-dependent protein
MSLKLADLETPIPVVDLDRLTRNLDRAAEYTSAHGLALRPHIKTHKSTYVAAEQMKRGAVGLTCATPYEAEVMSAVSDNILFAYPPVGSRRAERLMALDEKVKVIVTVDTMRAIGELGHASHVAIRPVGVYVELDVGMKRVGTARLDEAVEFAKMVQQRPPMEFEGIAFYPGHVREPADQQTEKLELISKKLDEALAAFERAGVPAKVVSGGSTPTLWRSHEIRHLTEIRPGTYAYNDRATATMGACTWDDCALTILATVVSTAVRGQAVIDAGTKALGREPLDPTNPSAGFGCLLHDRDVTVKAMSEEHGILDLTRTLWRPQVGDQVRVIPNHVCVAVHLHDQTVGVRGDAVETSWTVARGRGIRIQD